jgi:hypothetical protein
LFRWIDAELSDHFLPFGNPQSNCYERLNSINRHFGDAESEIRSLASRHGAIWHRYRGYLNCLRARVAYLQHKFQAAYFFLDSAATSLRATRDGNPKSPFGVQHLLLAECLILDARITTQPPAAQIKLSRAAGALRSARELLIEGRTYIWWWLFLQLLEAQLSYQQFLANLPPELPCQDSAIDPILARTLLHSILQGRNATLRGIDLLPTSIHHGFESAFTRLKTQFDRCSEVLFHGYGSDINAIVATAFPGVATPKLNITYNQQYIVDGEDENTTLTL